MPPDHPNPQSQPDVWRTIADSAQSEVALAVVTLLKSEGSTPAKIGSKAVVDSSGRIIGTIGGGALEGTAQRSAVEAIRSGQPVVFDFSLQGVGPPVPDPICGGKLRVLVDPTPGRNRTAYTQSAEARDRRQRGLLLTSVHTLAGTTNVSVEWLDEASLATWDGVSSAETLRAILKRETSEFLIVNSPQPDARVEVLVESIVPKPLLLIIGGGHVGQALALHASHVGFSIAVIDDRDEFTQPSLFPEGTATHCGNLAGEVASFPYADDTYIALVTRGHKCDAEALEICLHKPHAYLGMIGSRRKVVLVRNAFLESGRATEEEWKRIYTPIGLDIGAITVPEIATSIVAQLIAVRRKGSASGMPK